MASGASDVVLERIAQHAQNGARTLKSQMDIDVPDSATLEKNLNTLLQELSDRVHAQRAELEKVGADCLYSVPIHLPVLDSSLKVYQNVCNHNTIRGSKGAVEAVPDHQAGI